MPLANNWHRHCAGAPPAWPHPTHSTQAALRRHHQSRASITSTPSQLSGSPASLGSLAAASTLPSAARNQPPPRRNAALTPPTTLPPAQIPPPNTPSPRLSSASRRKWRSRRTKKTWKSWSDLSCWSCCCGRGRSGEAETRARPAKRNHTKVRKVQRQAGQQVPSSSGARSYSAGHYNARAGRPGWPLVG